MNANIINVNEGGALIGSLKVKGDCEIDFKGRNIHADILIGDLDVECGSLVIKNLNLITRDNK